MTDGVTEQVAAVVPAQLPPVQAYELGELVQLALRVELAPVVIDAGEAVTVHTGMGGSTVTVALAEVPVPPALTPATV